MIRIALRYNERAVDKGKLSLMQTRQQQITRTGSYNYLLFLPEAYETQDKWRQSCSCTVQVKKALT
jgi:hypothetical protein